MKAKLRKGGRPPKYQFSKLKPGGALTFKTSPKERTKISDAVRQFAMNHRDEFEFECRTSGATLTVKRTR